MARGPRGWMLQPILPGVIAMGTLKDFGPDVRLKWRWRTEAGN